MSSGFEDFFNSRKSEEFNINDLKILGLNKGATFEQIKKAHRKLALKYHPDRPDGDEERMQKINAAFDRLEEQEKSKKQKPDDREESEGSSSYAKNSNYQKTETEEDKANREMQDSFFFVYMKTPASSLRAWLQKGANVNLVFPDGDSVLIKAVIQNNLECVKILLENGAKINYKNNQGESALFIAVSNRLAALCSLLLENKADVNSANKDGMTALMRAAFKGDIEIVKVLLKNNADINKVTFTGKNAKYYAQMSHNEDKIIELLNEAELDKNPTMAMLNAFKAKDDVNVSKLREWYKKGADLNAVDQDGNNVLILAAGKNNIRCVNFLTQDSLVELNHRNKKGDSALKVASGLGYNLVVNRLLKKGANVELADSIGHTALMNAACAGHAEIVKSLLEAGAKRDVVGKDGTTIKACAAASKNPEIIALIENKKPHEKFLEDLNQNKPIDFNQLKSLIKSKDIGIDSLNEKGESILMVAVNQKNIEVVKFLIEKGANVHSTNNIGHTALMKASCAGNKDIVKIIAGAGAHADVKASDGSTVKACAAATKDKDLIKLVKLYLDYEVQKEINNEILTRALDKKKIDAVKSLLVDQVNLILEHDHYAKVALDDIKQVISLHHLVQPDHPQLIKAQDCLLGLNNDYYESLDLICGIV
jgi:ankyrin repeat protein